MASSTLSLDSLSSPSPSPSPPPLPAKVTQLDPDSELSELTDDDQDASDAVDKRAPSSVKEDDDHSHPIHGTSTSKVSRRGTHQRSSSRRGGAVGRKKRSSIVPAPMWGWAENKTASTSSTTAPVEEEEEEMSGPPRAMEEEEEEEAEEDEEEEPEDGDFAVNEDVEPERAYGPQRRTGPYISQRYNGVPFPPPRHWIPQRPRRARKGWRQQEEEPQEDDDEEAPDHKPDDHHGTNNKNSAPTINGDDEEEGSASGSLYPPTSRKKRSTKRVPPTSSSSTATLKKRKESGGDDHHSGSERPVHPLKKKKQGNNIKVQHDEDGEVSDVPAPPPSPPVPPPHAASDNEGTESEEEPFVQPPAAALPSTARPTSPITAMNSNTADAMSALTALATAADSIDIMNPHLNSMSTPNIPASIIPGFGSGSVKTLEAPASLLTPTALTTSAIPCRSPSPAAKSDAEASSAEDERWPTRSKVRNGKSTLKGKGGNVKGKAGDKNTGVIANGTELSTTTTTKKRPIPLLHLKIDTQLDGSSSLPTIDTTVEEDVNDRSLDNREDIDMDDPEEEEEEEEEEEAEEEEEPEEEQADEEANEVDEEVVDPEGDEDQEQDGADNENENENEDMEEGENGDENENENDEDPSPDGDADGDEHEESDLQPAHRAEALDVLATIELKFALLRERLYVEKMEGLAWEERMIQAAAHPEMQHLQKELTKRRDKRLELASRKRSYEVGNASKRRRADEDAVWSQWKFARDELQTDMISETNRKRRRLERERRAIERPQPIRRIPLPAPLDMHNLPQPPTLRKIIKSYPFGTRKQNKSDVNSHYHNHHLYYPKANYVYPEISTLSATDIANDLDFLIQNRRMSMGMATTSAASGMYDVQQQQHQHQHSMQQQQHYGSQQQQLYNSHQQQPAPQRNGAVIGMNMGGGIGRTINNVGMVMSNGVLPSQVQTQVQQQPSQMGLPPPNNSMHPHPHQPPQHSVGVVYEHQYGDMPPFGPPGGGRMREPQSMNVNSYQQQQHGLPPGHPPPPSQPATAKSRDSSYAAYSGPGLGSGGRMHQSSHGPMPGNSVVHGHGYGKDHEKVQGPGGFGPGSSNNGPGGGGHHHHTYFGQGGSSVGGGGSGYGSISSSSHMPGSGMNGRRSISPVHVLPNGSGGGGKPNGMWMSGYHGGKGGGGGDWGDARMMHEDEEREIIARERERERGKERDRDREIERERARYRDRDRDREHQELEHQRDHQHIQQHRQPPLSHLHGGSGAPPPQGPGVVPHHHVVPSHHHHRPQPHHHHVVHHHHGQGQSHTSTALQPGSVGSAPIVHSPRSSRDYDNGRPPQLHPGPGQPHSSDIMLSLGGKSSQMHPRDREREPWSGKGPDEQHHNPASSVLEYRERERDQTLREMMDNRKMHSRRPSSGPMPAEERDRPMAMPFVIPSSHQTSAPNSHLGSSSVTGPGTSPRGAPPSWNTPSSYDDAPRIPSSSSAPGYLNSPHLHDAHLRSPIQGHRYAPLSSTGSGMGRHITTGSSSSSSGLHHLRSTPPPSRARPPPSPSYSNSLSKSHRSPVTSPRLRPLSPPPPNNASNKLLSSLPTGSGYSSSPRLSGPGRTSTPTGHHPSSIPLLSTNTPSNQTDIIITKNGTPQSSSSSYPINSRNDSPLMSSLHAPLSSSSGRPASGGSGPDRDRERHLVLSPRLGTSSHPPPPLSKMSTAQTVEGH